MSLRKFKSQLNANLPNLKIYENKSQLLNYATDRTPNQEALPSLVLIPKTKEDILEILTLANLYKIPIVPRGAGTGTTGGALAINGAVILSMENFTKILELDIANKMAVVEPGVITETLQNEVEKQNLFYPPDPASKAICSIGGNVAENSGGPRCLKYGVTGDYVIGLEGVFADATPFNLGGKHLKNVAGYDIMRLLIGSEGTLAIITKITLKLRPLPKYKQSILLSFDSDQDAINTLTEILTSHISPAVAEFMDDYCTQKSAAHLGITAPFKHAPAALLIECDNSNEVALNQDLKQIEKISKKHSILRLNKKDLEETVWEIRRNISTALTSLGPKVSEDVVVPPANIASYLSEIKPLGIPQGIKVLAYGHLGDGNIHVNILKHNATDADWNTQHPKLIQKILELAVKHNGTITGEHGIGITKKPYMNLVFSKTELQKQASIKTIFDPNNILNPSKIL